MFKATKRAGLVVRLLSGLLLLLSGSNTKARPARAQNPETGSLPAPFPRGIDHLAQTSEELYPYVHQSWTTENGLPQNSVTSIVQTRDGHLWLGTLGGLVRFDGAQFTVFNTINTPVLHSNRVRALFEDTRGDLWIGTEHGGITRRQQGVFKNYSTRDGLPDDVVISISKGSGEDFWVNTTSGRAKFHDGRFITYPGKHDARAGMEAKLSAIKPKGGGTIATVNSICDDPRGGRWIGTTEGLFHFNHDKLIRFDDRLLSDRNVRSLLADREGNLWVGTDRGGLNRLRQSNLIAYTAERGLTDEPAMTVYEDARGTLWIGALDRGGLFAFHNGLFKQRLASPGNCIDSPASLAEDRSGNMWIGDWACGLSLFHKGRLTPYLIPGIHAGDAVRSLYADREGTLWIGSDRSGLYRLKDGSFVNYNRSDGLAGSHVAFITGGENGSLWIGTAVGISRLQGGKFTNYFASGMSLVRTISMDSTGALWIGTYGFGLARFKDGKFSHITSKDGLFDDVVSCIAQDDRNNLWMSGNRGIFKVSRAELDAFAEGKRSSITSISYGVPDGMAVSETNGGGEPTCWKARDGKLWFAMIRGVVMIDPDRINTFPPPVTIEQVILDGQTLPPEQTIRVEPGQRNLEIRYAGLSFSRPEQVKFKYKLTGLDKSWVDAGTRRAAYFPHLPPGSYIFQVMAENGDGIWNTQGTSLRIDVIPPFWRTGWFIALGLLLVAATGTLAHRFHVMRLVKTAKAREMFSRQLLEAQERERKRIAAELHDGLGQSLLIIKNRALLAAGAVDDPETAKEQMDEISAASSHAVEEVREICYNLRPYQLDRFGLTKTLQSICQRASRTSGIDFHVDLDSLDGLFSQEAEASIYRIIQEGVNNTIKHSQATEADLLIRKRNDEVEIRIRDNGRGFISAAATTTPQISPGFGLIGVAERVRMLGGTRVIESSPGSGTLITIKLPISRNSYES